MTLEPSQIVKKIWQNVISFSCVCPVVDHKFRHNIVKVAVDPRGGNRGSRVDPQTTLTVLGRNALSITGQTLQKLTSVCFLQCQIVRTRSLTHCINYKFMRLSAYWQWKLTNERARISTVIVKIKFVLVGYTGRELIQKTLVQFCECYTYICAATWPKKASWSLVLPVPSRQSCGSLQSEWASTRDQSGP